MSTVRHKASLSRIIGIRALGLNKALCRWAEKGFIRACTWLAVTFYGLTGDWRGRRPLLTRTSAHLAVFAVALIALRLSKIEWPAQAAPISSAPVFSASLGGASQQAAGPERENRQNSSASFRIGHRAGDAVARLAQPRTVIPERPRLDIVTYTVQAGDTVQAIAEAFRLQPTTIMWANSAIEDAPDLLRIGQEVIILPIDGVYHTVAEGDTLASIAEKYKVTTDVITSCEYNHLTAPDYALEVGMRLIVPGGEKPYVPKVVTSYTGPVPEGARGTGAFQWPVLGRITQGYWYGHRAIDIGAPVGSAVLAADGGFVSFAGWTDVGYGYLIVVDHANGFATYYAHLSNIYVYEGQAVERGQVLGASGNTGWSTGPHLHFEVRYYGVPQNPRAYLP